MIDRKELITFLEKELDYFKSEFDIPLFADLILELDVEEPKKVVGVIGMSDKWHGNRLAQEIHKKCVEPVLPSQVCRDTYDGVQEGIKWSNTPENNGVFGKL